MPAARKAEGPKLVKAPPAETDPADNEAPTAIEVTPFIPPLDATFVEADLRPGFLLLIEFSRPGGVKYEKDEGARRNQRVIVDNQTLEKMSSKTVNTAYAKLVARFPHTPFGFYCENEEEIQEAQEMLVDCRKAAYLTNLYAQETESPRRVRIDTFPMKWDHKNEGFRKRMGEMIAMKLIDLRAVYTSSRMWEYRVKMDRVRNMDKLVMGPQHELVTKALAATEAQRKTMVAIYGDKVPRHMLDSDGNLKKSVQLNFNPIDRAIRAFYPEWDPPSTI